MVKDEEAAASLCSTFAKMASLSSWVREQLSQAAAAAVPVHAIHRWPQQTSVIAPAADCIRNLSFSERSLNHLRQLQAVFILFDVLEQGHSPSVTNNLISAIANMMEHSEIQRQARSIAPATEKSSDTAVGILLTALSTTRVEDCQIPVMGAKVIGILVNQPNLDEEGLQWAVQEVLDDTRWKTTV